MLSQVFSLAVSLTSSSSSSSGKSISLRVTLEPSRSTLSFSSFSSNTEVSSARRRRRSHSCTSVPCSKNTIYWSAARFIAASIDMQAPIADALNVRSAIMKPSAPWRLLAPSVSLSHPMLPYTEYTWNDLPWYIFTKSTNISKGLK